MPGRGPDFGVLSRFAMMNATATSSLQSGWNPSFEVEGTTFGEMCENDPRLIGPRVRVFDRLRAWILENSL